MTIQDRYAKEWECMPSLPEPLPLLPELEKAAPYPIQALGELLGGAAQAIVEAVQVPDALAAQSILSAAAMAAQAHGNAQRAGQQIPLSLFALTVAESGDRKSAADRLAVQAHQQHQRELLAQHKAEAKEYRNKRDAFQKARSNILDKAKGDPEAVADELGNLLEPKAPPEPFILSEEPTLEGLQKSLLRGYPSQGLFSDEGGQFFGGHATKPENALKSVAGLSKLWDGAPISRTRASEGESSARYGCRLSAHLMIQPIVATEVLSNPIMQGQGFLARFLIAWPESLAGTRFYRDADPSRDARLGRYWQRMARLLAQEPGKDENGELAPPMLVLEPAALAAWITEHDAIERQLGLGGDMQEIKPTAAKGAENLLRIAGVFAVVEGKPTICIDLIERAGELVRWYLTEALRLTNPSKIDAQLLQAQKLLDWLLSNQRYSFDARTLQREGPPFVRKSAKQRDSILAVLVEYRWLNTIDGKTFNLNPVATTATFATNRATQGPEVCDTIATRCDSDTPELRLSQPVATLSRQPDPATTGLVAEVANVAAPAKFRGEL
ncbi:YfjI family protein [Pseudomonas sp. GOM6]|uniref:YfjI family protein n=1 Tax=Pseudomonas sp. GOM6 TaxID=3036944 RepID=UPI0024094ACD|nr:YfjI family protein [Pseudomonas sp. GOM6]MDG1581284.1 YfjI family protein [Pseudomonas sp. GOM6]